MSGYRHSCHISLCQSRFTAPTSARIIDVDACKGEYILLLDGEHVRVNIGRAHEYVSRNHIESFERQFYHAEEASREKAAKPKIERRPKKRAKVQVVISEPAKSDNEPAEHRVHSNAQGMQQRARPSCKHQFLPSQWSKRRTLVNRQPQRQAQQQQSQPQPQSQTMKPQSNNMKAPRASEEVEDSRKSQEGILCNFLGHSSPMDNTANSLGTMQPSKSPPATSRWSPLERHSHDPLEDDDGTPQTNGKQQQSLLTTGEDCQIFGHSSPPTAYTRLRQRQRVIHDTSDDDAVSSNDRQKVSDADLARPSIKTQGQQHSTSATCTAHSESTTSHEPSSTAEDQQYPQDPQDQSRSATEQRSSHGTASTPENIVKDTTGTKKSRKRVYVVQAITGHGLSEPDHRGQRHMLYLVTWQGHHKKTWEPRESFLDPYLVSAYHERVGLRPTHSCADDS